MESLHGAIMADFYRTPWIPVASPKRILKFKWLDWCQSLDLPYEPYLLPPSDYVDHLMQGQKPDLAVPQPQRIHVSEDEFDVHRTPLVPTRQGRLYQAQRRVRRRLRTMRGHVVDGLASHRDGPLFRSWNARYRDQMTGYFSVLTQQQPFLSTAAIRAQRIDQLNTELERMRQDYGA